MNLPPKWPLTHSKSLLHQLEGFKNEPLSDDSITIFSPLREVHPLASMTLTRQLAKPNELVASRVLIDRSTGICPVTKAEQRLIVLEPDQRKQLHDDLLELSKVQYENFPGKRPEESAEKAVMELKKFSDWLK